MGRPIRFVECKMADTTPAAALLYLKGEFPGVDAIQLVAKPGVDRVAQPGIRVVSADSFLNELTV